MIIINNTFNKKIYPLPIINIPYSPICSYIKIDYKQKCAVELLNSFKHHFYGITLLKKLYENVNYNNYDDAIIFFNNYFNIDIINNYPIDTYLRDFIH